MNKKIPFTLKELESNSFHPIVFGSINGAAMNLIVDTGASRTVIDKSFAKDIEIINNQNEEPFAAGINAEKMEVQQVKIPVLKLGEIRFNEITVFTTDLSAISELYEQMVGLKIGGLIGCDFLKQHNAVVNFKENIIHIHATQKNNE
ncbi:MAG: retropepsin-like aspartic protease [Bacteroidales bacterium]